MADSSHGKPPVLGSVPEFLFYWSKSKPNKIAFVYLKDGESEDSSITYLELYERSLAVCSLLKKQKIDPGDRVLLLYPTGLDFISAFIGSLMAGGIAIPAYPPSPPSRLHKTLPDRASLRLKAICRDVEPSIILSTERVVSRSEYFFQETPELKNHKPDCHRP